MASLSLLLKPKQQHIKLSHFVVSTLIHNFPSLYHRYRLIVSHLFAINIILSAWCCFGAFFFVAFAQSTAAAFPMRVQDVPALLLETIIILYNDNNENVNSTLSSFNASII